MKISLAMVKSTGGVENQIIGEDRKFKVNGKRFTFEESDDIFTRKSKVPKESVRAVGSC